MSKIVVLGCGVGRFGAALLAHQLGYDVFVTDSGVIKQDYKDELNKLGIPLEEGGYSNVVKILDADVVIKSPGIPNENEIVQAIIRHGTMMIDEIDFASKFTTARLIGVTGTNGKSTTSYMIYSILKTAGLDVDICGNVGRSMAYSIYEDTRRKIDYYVLELSSFQLEYFHYCRLNIACILNISNNHLDRYSYDFDKYVSAKKNILMNMTSDDHFVFNDDDLVVKAIAEGIVPQKHPVGVNDYLCGNDIVSSFDGSTVSLSRDSLSIHGEHNLFDVAVAMKVAQILGVSDEDMVQGITTYMPLKHRIEKVCEINGVAYYDDSKSTTVMSAVAAMRCFTNGIKHIIWLVGGYDKGNDYSQLMDIVMSEVKLIVCIGKDNRQIFDAFNNIGIPIYESHDMSDAVLYATANARSMDIVLLSPACASYDMYKNFEERGSSFKSNVLALQMMHSE